MDTKKKALIGDFKNAGREWRPKGELQQFANRTGLTITVCHFPPGTSKWNKIEHRLLSHAFKWIRMLHRCWTDGVAYDEARYLRALTERGSPLALAMEPTTNPGK